MNNYKQITFCLTCIVLAFLLAGCSGQVGALNDKNLDLSNDGYEFVETYPQNINLSKENSEQLNDLSKDDLTVWIGEYSFYESTPHVNPDAPDMFWDYTINIFKENDDYLATVYVDGFQTMKRIKAKVLGDSENISLIFEEYLPGDSRYMDIINKGDKLLSFKRHNSDMLTEWGALKPMLPENKIPNKIYFNKTN